MATGQAPTAQEMMRAFGVTEQDLTANRDGKLGPHQVRRLNRYVWMNLALMVVLVGGLVAIVLAVGARPIQWWRWLLVAVLALGVVAAGATWVRKMWVSGHDATVEHFSGPVTVFMAGTRGKRLQVGTLSFILPISMRRVAQDAFYDVYVVLPVGMVVAMLPIASP